jgi:type VI secretion system protein ImpJ
MKTPQRPVWSEGTFLSPQHLQAQDRFHEALLAERIAALAPHAWGVATLEVDQAALGAGELRVERFEGVLPDGLAVAFAAADGGAPPPRAVAEHFPAAARSLDVWLAVPREREGVPAYADAAAGGPRARFAVTSAPIQDATAPASSAVVAFARPDPVILLGAESREDHEVLKIAELVRTGSGQLALSDRYVPPLLRIAGAPRLLGGVRDLVTRLLAKQRELAEGRRPDLTAAEVTRLVQAVVVSGAAPRLAHLADQGDAPPLALYLALVELAGQLAAFGPDTDVAGLPKYAHADLRATFEPLLARIVAFVGGLAKERFTRVPLEVRGLFQIARLADEKLLHGARLFLAVKSDIPEAQVAEQLPRLCKIAAAPDVQGLVQAAAPGVPLQAQHRPPPELPPKPGVVYFALAQGDRLWKNVVQDRTLAVYLPPPFDPSRTTAELLAITAAQG